MRYPSLKGKFPKCVSSTKKRYEEIGTVYDRNRSERLEKTIDQAIKNSSLILMLRLKGRPTTCHFSGLDTFFFTHKSKSNILSDNEDGIRKRSRISK
ncbi:hypothetical protein BpHYR1_012502 [Brachionus plicatilis]|uniref:Uncharacterized protein n=1 Tax=Brachionus plicatilis TaxID=10195 RepID=A0A3M7SVV9_BRAPC|nr:hypothetical protein BpHYR1_012502 [Brachionus plicatilis]